MMDIAHPPKRASALGDSIGPFARALFKKAHDLPGAAIVVDSLSAWWQQHPLRTVGVVAGAASKRLIRPVAERNPQTLVLGAAVVGALLVFSRPWRWILRPALFIGLLPQLTTHVMKRMPIESWVQMAANVMARNATAAAPARRATTSRSPDPRASDLP